MQDIIIPSHTTLRMLNTGTIRRFVEARTDEEKRALVDLFADDCCWGGNLPAAVLDVGDRPEFSGKDAAQKFIEWKIRYLPEQVFVKPVVYQTTDPDHYYVVAKHKGFVEFPAYGERRPYCNNVFLLEFYMTEGKIRKYVEYSNMQKLYEALEIPLPEVIAPEGWPPITAVEFFFDIHQMPKLSMPETPDVIPWDDRELRQKNIEILRKYVDARLPEQRCIRWDLFDNTGTTGAAGGPIVMGKPKVRACTEWNMIYFPDTVFNNTVVFQTQDPNLFLVESDGDCYLYYPAHGKPRRYLNKFWHIFRMADGKILDYYEYSNALLIQCALGLDVPKLEIPEGWK